MISRLNSKVKCRISNQYIKAKLNNNKKIYSILITVYQHPAETLGVTKNVFQNSFECKNLKLSQKGMLFGIPNFNPL